MRLVLCWACLGQSGAWQGTVSLLRRGECQGVMPTRHWHGSTRPGIPAGIRLCTYIDTSITNDEEHSARGACGARADMAKHMQLSGSVCPAHTAVPAEGTLGDYRGDYHLQLHLDSVIGTRVLLPWPACPGDARPSQKPARLCPLCFSCPQTGIQHT